MLCLLDKLCVSNQFCFVKANIWLLYPSMVTRVTRQSWKKGINLSCYLLEYFEPPQASEVHYIWIKPNPHLQGQWSVRTLHFKPLELAVNTAHTTWCPLKVTVNKTYTKRLNWIFFSNTAQTPGSDGYISGDKTHPELGFSNQIKMNGSHFGQSSGFVKKKYIYILIKQYVPYMVSRY